MLWRAISQYSELHLKIYVFPKKKYTHLSYWNRNRIEVLQNSSCLTHSDFNHNWLATLITLLYLYSNKIWFRRQWNMLRFVSCGRNVDLISFSAQWNQWILRAEWINKNRNRNRQTAVGLSQLYKYWVLGLMALV